MEEAPPHLHAIQLQAALESKKKDPSFGTETLKSDMNAEIACDHCNTSRLVSADTYTVHIRSLSLLEQ
jgi:hypothetical protein